MFTSGQGVYLLTAALLSRVKRANASNDCPGLLLSRGAITRIGALVSRSIANQDQLINMVFGIGTFDMAGELGGVDR